MATIREAVDSDGEAVASLIEACFVEYPGCVFARAEELPELDVIASHFAAAGGLFWVAIADTGLVGCVGYQPLRDGDAELKKLYVDRSHRGGGIAHALLAKVVQAAEGGGAKRLELWSDTRFDRAHRFYEKAGFLRTGERRFLADISDSFEDRFVRPLA